jgi:cytochrome c-type biogenesis protein CcmF
MTALLGFLAIVTAFVSSVLLAIQGFRRQAGNDVSLAGPVYGLVGGGIVAMLALQVGLLTNDYSIAYIANNSTTSTPLLYKIASAWAALEGSIVLWGLILAIFVGTVYAASKRLGTRDPLGSGALGVMGIISAFFFGLMFTVSDPFAVCTVAGQVGFSASSVWPWAHAQAALEGFGPNPLLQNHPLMAIHPPMLYVGYVGLSVPFAFAMSALITGPGGTDWLRRTRSWTLVAWIFLTVGIVLGGLWSYDVLGWGGFWAWDAVENASFMPWLLATAFLHSSAVQLKRGMLQSWNFVLVISTFGLTILGTFITRSGIVNSVHAFTQSAIGPILLWFLAVVLVFSFGLFVIRAKSVASAPRLDSLASREGAILANNLILSVFAFVVLTGTMYPFVLDALTGSQVGVGPPFFNKLATPIGLILLLAMAVGSITPWRAAKGSVVWARIRNPLRFALAVSAVAVLLGRRSLTIVAAILLASFVVAVASRALWDKIHVRHVKTDEGYAGAALHVMRSEPGYWGGQIAHIGVAILAVGLAFTGSLVVKTHVEISPGDTVQFVGFDVTYVNAFNRVEANRFVSGALMEVSRDGKVLVDLQPRLNSYSNGRDSVGTPDVYSTLRGDLYFSLRSSVDQSPIAMDVFWFPDIWLVWLGGLLAGIGGIWAWLARKPVRKTIAASA